MIDRVSTDARSRNMRLVRGRDTTPEMLVRRQAHRLGYRFRLHRRDLPGTPDLVFPGRRKAVFVNGCFWHQHDCPRGARPASNTEFWEAKLSKNVERDRKNIAALTSAGWSVLVVWECETKSIPLLSERLAGFLK